MASVVEVKTSHDFNKVLEDANGWLVVSHFWASWAPQCEQMNEVLAELAKDTQYINCKFVKVEAESVPEVSQKYQVTAVPTCVLIKNNKVVDSVNGANAAELTSKVARHASPGAQIPSAQPPPKKEDLNTRLKQLINSAPVMLFMKGTPDEARCGFSKTMMGLLKDQGVKFGTFNILEDEEVRQGLKTYSDWPTYPQLYANGELLGGLDIVKEMIESGELKDSLPQQQSLDDRLKSLINKDRVVVFMKGNPEQARCGFSKTLVAILAETGVEYGHFDILSDEEVRQGLKKFSNWPTYPQIYVKGELIGGLDIIKELKETGELESSLKGDL